MSVPLPRSARALRLEFKRNAVPYLLPLLAAVFYFDTLRTADGFPAVWTLRASVIGDHMLFEFSAFAGALGAWAGSREGRRKTVDLVATTPRAAWSRLSIALAGTLSWIPAGVSAATQRFAALSASARHAWLATHLAALRAGHITLAQIP